MKKLNDMSWRFGEQARAGAETALDACDYFEDDVKDVWRKAGSYTTPNDECTWYSVEICVDFVLKQNRYKSLCDRTKET